MLSSKGKIVACIAPHPDDETLGCGGTLLKHIANGDIVHWIIVTEINAEIGFSPQRVESRRLEIQQVAQAFGFSDIHQLGFPTMRLDRILMLDLVSAIGHVVKSIGAEILYVPYRNDAHSDHAVVFDASVACAKSFRYPSVKSVLAYETLSETEFGLKPEDTGFRPNLFVGIDGYLERKIQIMRMFAGEMADFPFPRSDVTLRALAQLRGSQTGTLAAEAFMLLKEIR
jgi:LmbE family N-acetylglucosaminyl deacetylase